jgi:transposase InsO family protein
MTEKATKEFVRQRIMEIMDQNPLGMYLIHDNAPQFTSIDYPNHGINGIDISVAAPNMNAFAERVVRTT